MLNLMGLFMVTLGLSTGDAAGARRPPVVMLSIDGLRPDYVLNAEKLGLRIPNLRALRDGGAFASGVRGVLPTITYPSHVSLITGVAPDRHGIRNNWSFDPLQQNQGGWHWYASDIQVPTLWDVTTAAGKRAANIDWPVSVGAGVAYNIPQIWRAGTADDAKLLRAVATPGLISELEAHVGHYARGYDYHLTGDARRAAYAVHLLRAKHPDLLTVYFGALDAQQHASGVATPSVLEVLEQIDALVGELWRAARDSGGGEAYLCVVSDHGFAPVDKEIHLNVALKREGLLQGERGRVSAWEATTWSAAGTALVAVRDVHDASVRGRLRALLGHLRADPTAGIAMVTEVSPHAEDAVAFVLLARPGFEFGSDNFEGPLITPAVHKATHGYSPEDP
ncbi:MAG TPA: ectonucleotide pyrophosphatase/phosphodiesterase, partial [Myxococcota bacterium]|nr:ectonucleotide pyrophosphatase/phosphodiesterase [Myxococcota bacterium]